MKEHRLKNIKVIHHLKSIIACDILLIIPIITYAKSQYDYMGSNVVHRNAQHLYNGLFIFFIIAIILIVIIFILYLISKIYFFFNPLPEVKEENQPSKKKEKYPNIAEATYHIRIKISKITVPDLIGNPDLYTDITYFDLDTQKTIKKNISFKKLIKNISEVSSDFSYLCKSNVDVKTLSLIILGSKIEFDERILTTGNYTARIHKFTLFKPTSRGNKLMDKYLPYSS